MAKLQKAIHRKISNAKATDILILQFAYTNTNETTNKFKSCKIN